MLCRSQAGNGSPAIAPRAPLICSRCSVRHRTNSGRSAVYLAAMSAPANLTKGSVVPPTLLADSGAAEGLRLRQVICGPSALSAAGETTQGLRDAAGEAHRCGDTAAAIALYNKILVLFPATPEAVEAVFYLSGIDKGAPRPTKRAEAKETGLRERALSASIGRSSLAAVRRPQNHKNDAKRPTWTRTNLCSTS
jgi:hypothetical protein